MTRSVFATKTLRQSGITLAGTIANGALGAIFYIVAARFLGPASFGLMSVAIMVLTLVADIGDLGTDTGLVRFVGKYIKTNRSKAYRFMKLGLEVKLVVGLLVFVAGWFLSPVIARSVFVKPELESALRFSFAGVGFLLLLSFTLANLQALQRFWGWSGVQVGTNLFRVLIILALLLLGNLSLSTALATYISMPLIGFFIGLFLIPSGFHKVKGETSVAGEFFKYKKWVAAFTVVAAFGARLDTFNSARLLSSAQLGIYSAANRLVQIVPQIVSAIGTVIAPKMAGIRSVKELVDYLKKTQVMVLGLAILGILAIPVVLFLIPYLFGSEYLAAGPIFIVLFFAMLIFLISIPVHMAVFYYFSKPSLFFWLSLGHLAIIAGLGWYLVTLHGAIGAAVAVLIGQIFNFIIPTIWVLAKIRKSD